MAQLAASTANTLTAVAPAVSGSMKAAGSALGLAYCPLVSLSAQASVPPLVPAMSTGAPMARGVGEPATPSSSVRVKDSRAKDGPTTPQTGTSAEPPGFARMLASQPFTTASSGSTHTPVPRRLSAVRPVCAVSAAGMPPVSPVLPLRSRLVRALSSARSPGMLPVSPFSRRSMDVARPPSQVATPTPCQSSNVRGPRSSASKSPTAIRPVGTRDAPVQRNCQSLCDAEEAVGLAKSTVVVSMRRERQRKAVWAACGLRRMMRLLPKWIRDVTRYSVPSRV